jgi:tRNA(Ile)-lysidine synthase
LKVRSWRPGDAFQPLGMGGRSVKLSDFFTNIKLPRRARERWPLILSGDQIVWIPGLRLDHRFRVRENSQQVVCFRLQHISLQ